MGLRDRQEKPGCRAAPRELGISVAYDTSPVVQGRRTVVMPLDRQYRYSTGVQYDFSKDLTLGAAYTLIDAGDAPLNTEGGLARGNLVGHYSPNFIHAIGVNLAKRF